MRLSGRSKKQLTRFVVRLKDGNVLRFGVLTLLIAITTGAAVISSCKSRYGFTNQGKNGAQNNGEATPGPKPASTTGSTGGATSGSTTGGVTGGSTTGSTNQTPETAPSTPGGPVAGIEAWQNGKLVTTIETGVAVQFKPTSWTRDTSATSGCDINKGIVQASWTIGSRAAVDIQRFAGQDCRLFDYSGTFTKPGNIVVQLDVVTLEGEQANAQVTFPVTGAVISNPNPPSPVGPGPQPGGTPTQK